MASSKSSARSGKSKSKSAASGQSRSSASRASNGSSRSSGNKPTPERSQQSPGKPASQNGNGVVETVKSTASNAAHVLNKANGPAVALAAAAAGVAGGLILKSRNKRAKVLGVALPRSSELDAKSIAKTLGDVSKQFGQTSKTVSRDIERIGDQAERIGRLLG